MRFASVGYDYVEEVGFDLVIENTTYYKPNRAIRNGYTFAVRVMPSG